MTDLSKLLNKEQLEAATAPDGPLLILAAAGTGKTRTLVYRVVHLIERGVPMQEIVLLTFTNRAAREMIERAESVTGGVLPGMWSGTFHHIANRMLRKFSPRLGYAQNFAILDAEDQKSLMGQCIKADGHAPKQFPRREAILGLVSGAANRGLQLEQFIEDKANDFEAPPESILKVASLYGKRKADINAMDFDDLLVNALRLLKEDEGVRAHYQNRFRHVLVDEYQDTNKLQAEFVDILAAGHRNLSVVGDDFQCIYSWRGSNYMNIMEFPERYPDTKIVKLEQNYRSRPEILNVANASIENNVDQFDKVLRPTLPPIGKTPRVYNVFSDKEQSDRALEAINDAIADGYSYSDIAILYRSHFHALDMELSLINARIPYTITSGVGFFEQAHIKDIISLLRLAVFPCDWTSFSRIISLLPGVGAVTVERMWTKMGSAFQAEKEEHRNNLLKFLPAKAAPVWKPVSDALAQFTASEGQPGAPDALVTAFKDAFYTAHLKNQYGESHQERSDDINEFLTDVRRNGGSLRDYLGNIALLTNVDFEGDRQSRSKSQEQRLLLSTIHQAKGLEWPVVIILWLVESMFPSARSMNEDGDVAEERRLFYVAVTRAKDRLHLMVPKRRYMHDGTNMECVPSRFIREIPKNLLESVESSYGPYSHYAGNGGSYNRYNRSFF